MSSAKGGAAAEQWEECGKEVPTLSLSLAAGFAASAVAGVVRPTVFVRVPMSGIPSEAFIRGVPPIAANCC